MAGKWHIGCEGHADGTQKALPFGKLVQAYTQGYQANTPGVTKTDTLQVDAFQQGAADAGAGRDPGFVAEPAPPPEIEPPVKKKDKHEDKHKEHRK